MMLRCELASRPDDRGELPGFVRIIVEGHTMMVRGDLGDLGSRPDLRGVLPVFVRIIGPGDHDQNEDNKIRWKVKFFAVDEPCIITVDADNLKHIRAAV